MRKMWSRVKRRGGVMSVALLSVVMAACGGTYQTTIQVPVKPKLELKQNIKEFAVHDFIGATECAKDLQTGIYAKAANAEDLSPTIPGLPDLEGPLDINGNVEDCSLKMGHGTLKATISLSHGGKQLHQELVREETNRPGASQAEVRTVLVDRVVKQVTSIFVSSWKPEMRAACARGTGDPVWIAVRDKNWKYAIELLTDQTRKDPKDRCAWYNSGLAYEGLRQFDEAVKSYQKAFDLNQSEQYGQALSRAKHSSENLRVIDDGRKSRE